MASTALPPLPSPQPFSPPPLLQQPPSRDLTRSFSEASANTNGSRHRRGGTVCEFSFESLITNSPRTKRSNSLPLEVQIQVHYAPTPTGNNNAPSRWRLDSNGDDSLVFLDKPKKSRPAPEEEEKGYISPLEEEQFLNGSVIHAVPKSASDMDASPQTSTSNPQDSLCGDDDEDYNDNEMDDSIVGTPTKKKPHGEESAASSPFSKLKDDAPLMSAGESWMLQWCNHDTTAVADVPFSAVTPTQSPSNSSTNTSRSSRSVVRRRVAKPPKSPLSQEQPAPGDKARLEYLPKNLALEQKWRTNHAETSAQGVAAVSGWVAFGFGDSLLEKLRDDGAHLDRGDIAYIIAPSASNKLWVSSKADGTFENLVDWQDCRVEVHEISRLRGRAVVVKRQDQAVCTLLPVCLAEHYDGSPQLFDPTQCFPHGDYLPDEQQYTTMHIMFALDSLLKANQTWMY
ncbi:expressed unknown protein [Seminavis robusta]|uniref:Uncharacterized protein n=1 Tax=Seminavis robusta TaxID=568900 RepID=A0A9N8EVH0_9STRA|nr:expressed unknown protein [Seminavis robusta]|eukprot:Sro1729_g294060.1 n/a (455) ;mRNA; r:19873-21237